jgi:hypothetical protein
MAKSRNRIPPALRHGIYSGIGLLPTESRSKFRKFRKQIFAELNLFGRSEEDIGEQIVLVEWRRKNLSTYVVAERARSCYESIFSAYEPRPELKLNVPPPSKARVEELRAETKQIFKRLRTELGPAIELVEIGEMSRIEYLEKELAIRDRLDAMITRLYKKLAYVRAIKSMARPSLPAPSPRLLENAA